MGLICPRWASVETPERAFDFSIVNSYNASARESSHYPKHCVGVVLTLLYYADWFIFSVKTLKNPSTVSNTHHKHNHNWQWHPFSTTLVPVMEPVLSWYCNWFKFPQPESHVVILNYISANKCLSFLLVYPELLKMITTQGDSL